MWFASLSLVGAYLVSWLIMYYSKKYKRESIILYTIAFVVFLALIVIPLYGVVRIIETGFDLSFHSFC